MSARTIYLLLLYLLVAGADSSPDVPRNGKDRSKPGRASSPALPASRRGGGRLSRKGISAAPGSRRSGQLPLSAPKADLGPLAQYFGKFRLLVLAAPDPMDNFYRLMEKQIDVRSRELRCQLAVRDLLVLVLFQGTTTSQGKVVSISQQGKVVEEKVEPEVVGQIMQHLSLKEGQFGMVLLRKSMQLYERFPYAVRMEAVLETVDQMPLRKIESITRRGKGLKCKGGGTGRLGSGQLHTNNRKLVNRTLANRSLTNRTLVNRSLPNWTMVNGSLVNAKLRSVSPNSQKLIRSQSIRSLGKSEASAPDSSSLSGITLGKQKGSTLTPSSVAEKRAEGPRSAAKPRESSTSQVPPGQGTVDSLMDQIKQKVQQMLVAKHRYPGQRRPTLIKQNGSQVSRAGPHTYHTHRVQSTGSTPVPSTMAPLKQPNAGTARDFQIAETSVLKWDQLQFSTAQQPNERSFARPGKPRSSPSTIPSQQSLLGYQTLENFSTVPTAPTHQPTKSGHWDYGSPSTQATLSNTAGQVSPIPGKATFSSVTRPQETPASNPESNQAKEQQTDSPIGNTLPKSPRVPVTAQPIESRTHDKAGGALTRTGVSLPLEAEQEGGDQRLVSPATVQRRGRKVESQNGGNSLKRVRNKGRKNRRNRKNKKSGSRNSKQIDNQELVGLLDHFRNKRRLLLITAPSKDSKLYIHQRDEYLEHVCQLAVRRISVIAILGSLSNSTLKVEHYQTENELALENPVPESVSVDLTAQLRREFGMTFDEFFMVLVDYDMKVKQYFDVPIPIKILVDYMDTLPSRWLEIQEEKKSGVTCVKRDRQIDINKFLSRLQWKRRLLIISSPNEGEWAFQQQVTALRDQACNLGIRHFALLKLMGSGEDASGSLELFPLNGRSKAETKELSLMAVKGLREHFQVSEEHFMMLLIGKDGTINSWYLSPMWSLATIYELVDSMQLRQEEIRLQETLGIYCHEDEYSHHYRGYPEHA
ncbi:coiled-coil domain-containing protein 80-like [Heterodontus francisci]|uniref:coiled-coil domain-containing protein 80-like n=1 Tax=Heterodontus francisci TaxID=7792 RepID=UPI00355C9708